MNVTLYLFGQATVAHVDSLIGDRGNESHLSTALLVGVWLGLLIRYRILYLMYRNDSPSCLLIVMYLKDSLCQAISLFATHCPLVSGCCVKCGVIGLYFAA